MKCAMVGLSVIFETRKLAATGSTPQIIQKSTLIMNNNTNANNHHHRRLCSSPATPSFLDRCFLCRLKLLPGKDIYMYDGDKGFCSETCRCRQIFMDEEQSKPDAGNCSFAAASRPSPSPPPPSRHPKPTGNQARGFVY